jgi:peptidoglycan/xylan/chitin deacetylase (PgdA/CDA1 family)
MKNKLKLIFKEFIGLILRICNLVNINKKNKVYIFCFHEVTDYPSQFQKNCKLYVTKKNFIKQINYIKKNFNIIKYEDLNNKNIKNSALITFDDGYLNSFNYGLNFLKKNSIKPIFFLNMSAFEKKIPLLPASIEYMQLKNDKFIKYIKKENIKYPISLNINPDQMQKFNSYINKNKRKIFQYQGMLLYKKNLKSDKKDFDLGNHLYEHYNMKSLNNKQLKKQLNLNKKYLKKYKNFKNIMSIPNGVPKKCFNLRQIKFLKNNKILNIFSSANSNYNYKNFLFDRISLNNEDNTHNKIIFKLFQSMHNKIFLQNF